MGSEFWKRERKVWNIEMLLFAQLSEFEEWKRFHGALPFLRTVKVSDCPKLKAFPLDVAVYNAAWWNGGSEKITALVGIHQV